MSCSSPRNAPAWVLPTGCSSPRTAPAWVLPIGCSSPRTAPAWVLPIGCSSPRNAPVCVLSTGCSSPQTSPAWFPPTGCSPSGAACSSVGPPRAPQPCQQTCSSLGSSHSGRGQETQTLAPCWADVSSPGGCQGREPTPGSGDWPFLAPLGSVGHMEPCPAPNRTGLQRRMEHGPAFDMWRDYLGLAGVLAELLRERRDAGEGKAASAASPDTLKPASSVASPGTPEPALSSSPGEPVCAFCKHNGQAKHVYSGHSLRDAEGQVQCLVPRSYVCPQCGATQDRACASCSCPLTHRGHTSIYSRSPRSSAGTWAAGSREAPGAAAK